METWVEYSTWKGNFFWLLSIISIGDHHVKLACLRGTWHRILWILKALTGSDNDCYYFFYKSAPKYLFWFKKDCQFQVDYRVKLPTFMSWLFFSRIILVGPFWRQNQRSDKTLVWHCTICMWNLYLMYLVKSFAECSVGLHYTPLIVANLFQRFLGYNSVYTVYIKGRVYLPRHKDLVNLKYNKLCLFHLN